MSAGHSEPVTKTSIDQEPYGEKTVDLPRSEIEARMRCGVERRKYMKKGMVRRCYHNAKQILMAMCLMTAAFVGSSVATASKHMHN